MTRDEHMGGARARRLQAHCHGVGEGGAHAVAEQQQRPGGQRLQCCANVPGETIQAGDMRFVETLFASRRLHGKQVDIPRQVRQPRTKKTRAAPGMRQAHQARPRQFAFS